MEGEYDADYEHAQGSAKKIWTPVFEDWMFAPESGEKFESSSARWYYVPEDDGQYWNEERGWGARVPEALEAGLATLYEGASFDQRNFLLYDFTRPPVEALEGMTPGDEEWEEAFVSGFAASKKTTARRVALAPRR